MAITKKAADTIALAFGGAYSQNVAEVKSKSVYDSRTFDATVSNADFFTIPQGGNWPLGTHKTIVETNLVNSGQLPEGEDFLITHMGLTCHPFALAADVDTVSVARAFNNVLSSSYFSLTIANKPEEILIPGRLFLPLPMCLYGLLDVDAVAAEDPVQIGQMLSYGWYSFGEVPIPIGANESFNGRMVFQNPLAAVDAILDADASELSTAESVLRWELRGYSIHKK